MVLVRAEREKFNQTEHGHMAQGCERGVQVSQVSFHAPVTGRPAFSRSLPGHVVGRAAAGSGGVRVRPL